MTFSKSLLLTAALASMFIAAPVLAQDANNNGITLTSSEKSTLATIAAIDKSEILVSVVAVNKDVDSGITNFAKMMIDQHGSNLTQALSMANDKTLSGGESEKISSQGKKDLAALGALEGKPFEKAYVDAMVSGHEDALKLIDTKLMKTGKSEEMKKFLTDTRTAVAQHLEHAKKLQEEMKS